LEFSEQDIAKAQEFANAHNAKLPKKTKKELKRIEAQIKEEQKLSNICLGFSAQTEFEALMIREKMIEQRDLIFHDKSLPDVNTLPRINNRSFLLFAMVLFDRIDGSHVSFYNLDKLVDAGLLHKNACMINTDLRIVRWNFLQYLINNKPNMYDDIKLYEIKRLAETIMLECKSQIVYSLKKYHTQNEGGFYHNFDDVSELYESWLPDCEYRDDSYEINMGISTEVNHGKVLLGTIKSGIMYGLSESDSRGSLFFDTFLKTTNTRTTNNALITGTDVCQIMKVNLSPLLYHFPIPQSIDEVLVLRNREEIKAFREVFFTWCTLLKNGELNMAEKIKKDIQLAEKGLYKYRKWEDERIKKFNCIMDVIVGQIPYLSNLVGIISPFQTRNTLIRKKENSWIALLR
jgi:hypothetical protein